MNSSNGVRRRTGEAVGQEMQSSVAPRAAVDVKKQLIDYFKDNRAAAVKLMIAGLRFMYTANSNSSIFSRAYASLSKDEQSQQKQKMFTSEMAVLEHCRQLNINPKDFFALITPCSGLFSNVISEDLRNILLPNLKIEHVRANYDVLDFLLTEGFYTNSEEWQQKYGKIRMS